TLVEPGAASLKFTVQEAVDPAATVPGVHVSEVSVKGMTPVPVSAAVCGDPTALSVIDTMAVRVPAADGLNVTDIEQLLPAATDVPHVLVCAKSLAFIPVTAMLVRERVAVPVLVRVMLCAVLVVPVF